MAITVRKYNPGFLTDEEIVESFCVRTSEYDSIVESLGESDGNPSAHTIVIGTRGSGKTHLLLRIAAEMRRGRSIGGYFPIVFAEESYEVSTCGEFWLECLGRLAEQAPDDQKADLRLTYTEIRETRDDDALADRCLGTLLDFADRHETRLALFVENLNMLLPDMLDPDAGWKLRKTLQTERRITLIGSATSRFAEIDHPEQPLYDIFRSVILRPLSTDECASLWSTVSGEQVAQETVRPMQILTGGNPRMIALVAGFGVSRSLHDLMESLHDLIDDHTEYFKGHIEALPSQERRVYLALAQLWKPATTREVADKARIDTNRCSAFLKRLVDRGAVTVDGGTPRRRQYYLTERLYNIYYLLRRPTGEGQAVNALIRFMSSCYSPAQMLDVGVRIARESERADTRLRQLQELAFRSLLELPEMEGMREDLLTDAEVVDRFSSDETADIAEQIAVGLMRRAYFLGLESNPVDAIGIYERVMREFGQTQMPRLAQIVILAYMAEAYLLKTNDRFDEIAGVYDEHVRTFHQWRDRDVASLVNCAVSLRAVDLMNAGQYAEAAGLMEDTLGRFEGALENALGGHGLLTLSIVLELAGDIQTALSQIDRALSVSKTLQGAERAELIVSALAAKGRLMDYSGGVISETEAITMMEDLVELDAFPDGTTETLIRFSAQTGPERTLELIQSSGAAYRLLPLVVALQQVLGEEPNVALEVEEVAKDIRQKLSESDPDGIASKLGKQCGH